MKNTLTVGAFAFISVICNIPAIGDAANSTPAQTSSQALAIPQVPVFRAAKADLVNSKGAKIGSATIIETKTGIRVTIKSSELPMGVHGIHVHENGQCKGPDFASAGGHFNPDKKAHGTGNVKGPHAGDLGNINVLRKGPFHQDVEGKGLNLKTADPHSILKSGGTSIVIHAKEDDLKTDPSGNSGSRIACGIVQSLTGNR